MPEPSLSARPVALWYDAARCAVCAIDQSLLPHEERVLELRTTEEFAHAIRTMQVRGAPLIGVAAAFGLALVIARDPRPEAEAEAAALLLGTRPTAVNLAWALQRVRAARAAAPAGDAGRAALAEAEAIRAREAAVCSSIGDNGLPLLEAAWRRRRERDPRAEAVHVLTHCNAGWLATGEWGTALAPVYKAHAAGLPVHVWVDETRPRAQGASLTAWELARAGVPHTLVADTMAGHLMQRGRVDLVFVGTDRTARNGDVCNKIGTYGVALAAADNGVPFHPCVPTSSVDWAMEDGVRGVPIEERSEDEVTHVRGRADDGATVRVRVAPAGTRAANGAFDVTPARLVTALVTEHGVFPATPAGLDALAEAARAR